MNFISSIIGLVSLKHKTLNEWIAVYEQILDNRGYDPHTMHNYSAVLNHIRLLLGNQIICKIKPLHISTAIRSVPKEKSSTAKRILTQLRDVFIEAIANGWAEDNPAAHVRTPSHKIIRKRLSFEVWQQMLDHAHNGRQKWVESLLLLSLVTAQRRADLSLMKFTDIREDCLYIEQQKKAGKPHGARIALPLSLRLDVINLSLGDVIDNCKSSARKGETLLRTSGGSSIEVSSLSTRFNQCIRACLGDGAYKDYEWPSLHEVRSLSERLYRKQGLNTQILLGHKNQTMTDVYNDSRGMDDNEFKHVKLVSTMQRSYTTNVII